MYFGKKIKGENDVIFIRNDTDKSINTLDISDIRYITREEREAGRIKMNLINLFKKV